ncbi:unnamed protein product [Dimorphilus gyrociliatus]|uniref:Uncharacterized protein n=1 Tax=Dimorphilus gyrociliatus TaxID=2664684 RepID=A0A7I8VHY2_9ANNE|nr:unnamed protein product [Dimorphilus gyrociliatus]
MSEKILEELKEVKEKILSIPNTELISCVPAIVQIKITLTKYKQLVVCMQFSDNYPYDCLLVELKSKLLSDNLLQKMTKICEEELRKFEGEKQIIHLVKFVKNFIIDNPLCVCSDEILSLKNLLTDGDEIKLKQKVSKIILKLREGSYMINSSFTIPNDYPVSRINVTISDCNLPEVLRVNCESQCQELARRAVEPPLKRKSSDPPFEPTPSLLKISEFIINNVIRKYPTMLCPCCHKSALPADAMDVVKDHQADQFVERVYCGHLFHHKCIDDYMKTPPFTGGKKCPSCGSRIFHDKWRATPELAEARWAHKQARQRELDEVVDFLG